MTVKQLKEKLSDMDDSLKVYIYSDLEEAGGSCYGAKLCEEGENSFPSCRGDTPDGLEDSFVFLRGE